MEHITLTNKEKDEWDVQIGEAAINVLKSNGIKGEERENILEEAVGILKSCGDPKNEENNDTGLVIGYVQSGKTLSFTTLTALAAENGFNIIVVFAGTTKKLVYQTYERLTEDLDIENTTTISWKPYKNPTLNNVDELLSDFNKGLLNPNPVLLMTVMKNNSHLKNLLKLFETGLNGIKTKVLIIDDEADQASLNTKASKKNENETSAIYETIAKLKKTIKNHTFVQYTATPQAPLFISILDILSPSFVKLLTPGMLYTGGKIFFHRNKDSNYPQVELIPDEEIYSKDNYFTQIPQTLVDSTLFYYLTVVVGALRGERPQSHNRTMMVHPSQFQLIHATYKRWLDLLKERLLEELMLPDSAIDKQKTINDFARMYAVLDKNAINLPDFDEVIIHLYEIIAATPILMSNSSVKQDINWKKHYSLILVGGQVLDRGFTLEGLNVTYMPRSLGVGNADTIQQRCRFFGYKKKYLDMCKIFIPRDSRRAYIDYVLHEEHLRDTLAGLDGQNKNLKDFKRMFILSPDLNITRRNVISDDLNRYRMFGWRSFGKVNDNTIENNKVIESFVSGFEFELSDGVTDNTTEIQKHEEAIISSTEIAENLLLNLHLHEANNSLLLNYFISIIGVFYESNLTNMQMINVINMSCGESRVRGVNDQQRIKNLFQGSNAKTDYRGDREVKSDDMITIQIHKINIKETNKIFRTIAFHIPESFGQNIVTLDS